MSTSPELPIEIVIACHSPERRIGRAVESIVAGNGGVATATVVCHNIAQGAIEERIPGALRDQVRFLELHDGIPSPTGPFTLGLERATAPWVGIMGSDDIYEPGALAALLELSRGHDAVVPHLRHDTGSPVRTPPVRPFRRGRRDAARDRLYYRSAPLGIMNREFISRNGLGLVPGLRVGEDLRMSTLLWSLGSIAVQRRGPGYVIGSDAEDRVTMNLLPVVEELRHVESVWGEACLSRLTSVQRVALGTKYLRIHVFGVAYYRSLSTASWADGDREALAAATRTVLERAPHAADPLSRADRNLLDAILDLSIADDEVERRAQIRRRFLSVGAILPRSLSRLLHREAPLRFMAASTLVQ